MSCTGTKLNEKDCTIFCCFQVGSAGLGWCVAGRRAGLVPVAAAQRIQHTGNYSHVLAPPPPPPPPPPGRHPSVLSSYLNRRWRAIPYPRGVCGGGGYQWCASVLNCIRAVGGCDKVFRSQDCRGRTARPLYTVQCSTRVLATPLQFTLAKFPGLKPGHFSTCFCDIVSLCPVGHRLVKKSKIFACLLQCLTRGCGSVSFVVLIRIRLFMWMDPDPKIGGMVNKLYIFIRLKIVSRLPHETECFGLNNMAFKTTFYVLSIILMSSVSSKNPQLWTGSVTLA